MRLTERNPIVIGVIAIVVILAGTIAALTIKADTFAPAYSISANFRDTGGLMPGDRVTMAGVLIGHVGGVKQDGDSVRTTLRINHGVQLAEGSTVSIKVETLLGRRAVAVAPPASADWSKLIKKGEHLPGTGSSPTDVLEVQSDAQAALATLDVNALNQFLGDLAQVTTGKQAQVATIISGLNRLTSTVNSRQQQVSSLIDAANAVSATVESRNANLLSAVDNLDVVVSNLDARRAQLTQLLQSTQQASGKLATLLGNNRTNLTAVLSELEGALNVINQHQVDLAQTVSYLAGAVQGFSSVGYSGPANTPNKWANIFTVGLGPTSSDPVFGCGGELSSILSVAIGPDPVTNCAQYTGPIPGGSTSGAAGTAAAGPSTQTTKDSLNALLVPLLEGAK